MALIAFVDERTKSKYQKLKDGQPAEVLVNTLITRAIDKLRENPFCGIQIKKEMIPKKYKKYHINNLWKFNLNDKWRLTYSVTSDENVLVIIIIEWFDHKAYNKLFGYG